MMRDIHHEPPSLGSVGDDRRGAEARNLSELCDDWPPQRRATDGPVAMLADDIRQRLGPICRDWREDDFEAVVHRIARMKMRWIELGRAD
jgi:hypothetical protein